MFLNKNGEEKKTVFLFSGNGIHQTGMLTKLCTVSEDIKSFLEEFAEISDSITSVSLLDESTEKPAINQLRVIASEIAICRFWELSGLKGDIYIGHSLGEYAAAYCMGIFTVDSMTRLLTARNDILAMSTDTLKMCSFSCTEEYLAEIQAELGTVAEIAAYNSPERLTVVGNIDDIRKLCDKFHENKLEFFPIQVNGGSHSSIYLPYKDKFMESVGDISFCETDSGKRIISTVLPEGEANDMRTMDYWFTHMTSPVRFSQAVRRAVDDGAGMFIDIGVSPNTLGIAMNNVREHGMKWIPTVRAGQNYKKQMKDAFEQVVEFGIAMTDRFAG